MTSQNIDLSSWDTLCININMNVIGRSVRAGERVRWEPEPEPEEGSKTAVVTTTNVMVWAIRDVSMPQIETQNIEGVIALLVKEQN